MTDAYPYGDKCLEQLENGWHTLTTDAPYTLGPFTLPDDGECGSGTTNVTYPDLDGPNMFGLTILARTVKGATIEATVTEPWTENAAHPLGGRRVMALGTSPPSSCELRNPQPRK